MLFIASNKKFFTFAKDKTYKGNFCIKVITNLIFKKKITSN